METNKIFSKWDQTHSELWAHQPIRLEHEMHKSPAFSMEDLAKLIEGYPREHYSLVQTGARGSKKLWREGDIGNLSGREVIEAISRGGLWLNMRNVAAVDPRYGRLVDRMFEEIVAKVPDFEIPKGHQESILISAPDAQVYYHADMPGQSLVQIAGRKRVYVYPNSAPFITAEHLEDIALFNVEVDLPYKDWYDEHAKVLDICPGQMLGWQMNAPHRVENLDTFSVSMTISYTIGRNPPLRDRPSGQRHAAPSLRLQTEEPQPARSVVFRQGGDAEAVARRQMGQARARCAPPDRLPARRRVSRQDRRPAEGGLREARKCLSSLRGALAMKQSCPRSVALDCFAFLATTARPNSASNSPGTGSGPWPAGAIGRCDAVPGLALA